MTLFRLKSFYEKYTKRLLDIICAAAAILIFSWLYLIIAVLVRIKMGSPIFFKQPRPGMIDPKTGKERIFYIFKFRTMNDARDKNGRLLPDDMRLGKFGKMLRATSLDELPEAFNILKGDMSVIGPRPQLVRDMVFMSDKIRMRHTAKPGLSGLAQVMGRNALTWEDRFRYDLQYIEHVSFWNDAKLIWTTFKKVFIRSDFVQVNAETDLSMDYGDALLKAGKVSQKKYDELQAYALELIAEQQRNT